MGEKGNRKSVCSEESESKELRNYPMCVSYPIVDWDLGRPAHVAQLAEHILGKDEVTSSILVVGSR